jgi:curved DNA-binding protein CbpA
MQELRSEPRHPGRGTFSLRWQVRNGEAHSAQVRCLDLSGTGMGVECLYEIKPGSLVHVEAPDGSVKGEYVVVHCGSSGLRHRIGLEFRDEAAGGAREREAVAEAGDTEGELDFYDVLQISPKADVQTIHRVFRIMAARFHPDNPETGDVEQFLRLKRAYNVLSDPDRRSAYDLKREGHEADQMPIFELKEFVTGVEAESNRRLGVLSLLYNQRRSNSDHPGVSLLDLEQRMGFPREYLNFTMWYLRAKEFIVVADNSDFSLTAAGADYVERKAGRNEIVGNLLKPGAARTFRSRRGAKPTRKAGKIGPTQRLLPSAEGST